MKKIFRVNGMHCSSCVMLLEGIEDDLKGIKRTDASYHKGTLEVEWDEAAVSEEAIRAEVERLGYSIAD